VTSLPAPVVRTALRLLLRPALGPPVPVRAQRAWTQLLSRVAPLPSDVTCEPVHLGGRPAERLVAGEASTHGSLLLLHGGAFITGSPRTHRVFAGHLAAAARVPVHALDYRLAPEHPFPAPVDDARAAFDELAACGPVVVVGDSAGGTLALLLAQRLRDSAGPTPAGLALVSPLVDLTLASSDAYVGPDPYLRSAWAHQGRDAFVGPADARALSPLHTDLAGLPPMLVHVCGHERLRPEGERFVELVRAAGGEAELALLPGLWHDVHLQAHLVERGARATADLGRWVATRLAAGR
jgi:acetyl esterase/lipase